MADLVPINILSASDRSLPDNPPTKLTGPGRYIQGGENGIAAAFDVPTVDLDLQIASDQPAYFRRSAPRPPLRERANDVPEDEMELYEIAYGAKEDPKNHGGLRVPVKDHAYVKGVLARTQQRVELFQSEHAARESADRDAEPSSSTPADDARSERSAWSSTVVEELASSQAGDPRGAGASSETPTLRADAAAAPPAMPPLESRYADANVYAMLADLAASEMTKVTIQVNSRGRSGRQVNDKNRYNIYLHGDRRDSPNFVLTEVDRAQSWVKKREKAPSNQVKAFFSR